MTPLQKKILSKVEADTNGGCWLWTGATHAGYGSAYCSEERRNMGAHRLSFRAFRGGLTEGLVIDHKCRVTQCVNPDHLREITSAENVLCGEGVTAQNAVKTHCEHGHELTESNLYIYRGWRHCLTCKRRRSYEDKQRRKAERHARGLLRQPRKKQ